MMKQESNTLSNISDKSRLVYIDIAKSLGMLLIIWGHIRLKDWSNAFAYAFHIPLFFVLSGMVFDKNRYNSFRLFVSKKIKSLLIPYFIFSFLTWIIWAVFAYVSHQDVDSYWMPLLETFIARGSGGYLVHNVPLWFISCLFVMQLIYYYMADMKEGNILILSFIMSALSYCAITYCDIIDFSAIPWNIETALLGMPFYTVGHLVVRKWGHQTIIETVSRKRSLSLCIVILLFVLVVLGSSYNGSISFGHDDLGRNVFLTYGCAFLGCIMMIMSCMLLSTINLSGMLEQMMKYIIWFGKNSFNAMVIHNPIKGIVCVIVGALFHCGSHGVSRHSGYSFVAFVVTLVITILCIVFINSIKQKYSNRSSVRT